MKQNYDIGDRITLYKKGDEEPIYDFFEDNNFKYKYALILMRELVEKGLLTEREFEMTDKGLQKKWSIIKEPPCI